MTWVETAGGDFLNLYYVLVLEAEKVTPSTEDEPETWMVVAILSEVEDVPLAHRWPSEAAAQAWIRSALVGAGETVLGHVLRR